MPLVVSILTYLVSFSNISLNSLLIHALRKRKKLNIISYWLIFCLSISDVFIGIFGLIDESLPFIFSSSCEDNDFCIVTKAVRSFFANFSSTFVLVVAIDRFIHMKYPLQYATIMTKRWAAVLVCLNAVFTVHTTVTTRFLPHYQSNFISKNNQSYLIYRVVLSLVYIMTVVSVFILYVITYCLLRKRFNAVTNIETMGTSDSSTVAKNKSTLSSVYNNGRRSPDQEFALSILCVVLLLFLFEAPGLCMAAFTNVSKLIHHDYANTSETLLAGSWTYLIFQLNSSLNAVTILFLSRELRAFTRQFFIRCWKMMV